MDLTANPEDESRGLAEKWKTEIRLYEHQADKWHERSKKILKRYKDERNNAQETKAQFNIFWSNIQTLLPSVYGNAPKPNVTRRFTDKDDVGRLASEILERSVTYFIQENHFTNSMKQSVFDYLTTGRGTAWVRYVPHLRDVESPEITNSEEPIDIPGEVPEPAQEVYYEEVVTDYVHWSDFGHTIARTPSEIRAVWRIVYLDRDELNERFGEEIGTKIPLDYSPKDLKDAKIAEDLKKASVYEIWDKASKQAIWVHKDFPEPLDRLDDPLKIKNFFPCPMPMLANLANDTCIPTPDYTQYQDQANELDQLTGRIHSIQKSLKVAGVYDSSAKGVERLLTEGVQNQLIPVDQWAVFSEKGGLKGVINLLPLQEIASSLEMIYQVRDKVKADLYEISGISDIMRGISDPDETATGQTLKGQYSSIRLKDKQEEVARFARDIVVIMIEVIAAHFSVDTLKKISGVKLLTNQEKMQAQMLLAPPHPPMQQPVPMQPQMPQPQMMGAR